MAKWYGKIGYALTTNTIPGVWVEKITEREYYGDVLRNMRRLQTSGNLNDDVNISNEISIVSDPFANENFHAMRYIEYMGTKWKVTNVEVKAIDLPIEMQRAMAKQAEAEREKRAKIISFTTNP